MKTAVNGAIALWFGFHFRHHFHGPPVDYVGLAGASVASWIGVPGPGESVLIAAGIFAAKSKLDISEVLLVAWVAATAGGIAGWLIGMRAGRVVMSAPGPLQRARQHAIARGDEIFGRVPVLAVVLTPSWIAGIHRVRPGVYLPTNALSAALWSVGIGLGAYFAGPAVAEVVDDVGWAVTIGLVALIAVAIVLELRRRRNRRERENARSESEPPPPSAHQPHPESELGA